MFRSTTTRVQYGKELGTGFRGPVFACVVKVPHGNSTPCLIRPLCTFCFIRLLHADDAISKPSSHFSTPHIPQFCYPQGNIVETLALEQNDQTLVVVLADRQINNLGVEWTSPRATLLHIHSSTPPYTTPYRVQYVDTLPCLKCVEANPTAACLQGLLQ